jgi:hypothetical protein
MGGRPGGPLRPPEYRVVRGKRSTGPRAAAEDLLHHRGLASASSCMCAQLRAASSRLTVA